MVIDDIPKAAGMAYAIIVTVLIVVLLQRGKFSKRMGYGFLAVSTLFGFLVFAPMLPFQFQTVLLGKTKALGVPTAFAWVVLGAFVVLSFAFGRVFCGYVCPAGAVQELLFRLPTRKVRVGSKTVLIALRLAVLVTFLVLALVFSIGILKYLGIRDFFYLSFGSAFLYAFLAFLIVSIFAYRPFCRFACPYGALLSLATAKGRFKLRHIEDCSDCEICEEVCPTNEAGRADLKQECYMCGKCREACPLDAISYARI